MTKNGDIHHSSKLQRCQEYVQALEQEQKKIQVFQRELPLCLELVTQAIESSKKELLGFSEHVHGQSECSERTTSECGGGGGASVFEEFMPIKGSSSSSYEHESCGDDRAEKMETGNNEGDKKKSDWLRSVQLWNQSPDPPLPPKENQTTVVVEVKRNGGAFQPFQKEKPVAMAVAVKADSQPLKAIAPTPTTSSSTAETGGNKTESEQQKQSHRKQRRCWSSELHRRFLHALQQLGGSHVATPKQIRDLMKVDGLTNDEVKSHLQKYRLHTRRPATPAVTNGGVNAQPPQFMVVEGIWVPSQHESTNNRVYAPVAVQASPSGDRSSRRCKSPATSSTHTPHLLPLS